MKKIILLALAALMMAGCEYRTDAEIKEAKRLHGFKIIIVDSCEYIMDETEGYQGYYGFLPTKETAASVRNESKMN